MKQLVVVASGVMMSTINIKRICFVAVVMLILRQLLLTTHVDKDFMFSGASISMGEESVAMQQSHYKIKLIHVMNAYSTKKKNDNTTTTATSPYDQWSAMVSIQRAKQFAPSELYVDFVCAMFEEDQKALPDLPCRKVPLTRSTASEYPYFNERSKMLPFLQDIMDAAIQDDVSKENNNFYLMLTNSDIGLTKHFYQFIYPELQIREAFSINRLTVPINGINMAKRHATLLLQQIDARLSRSRSHTGYDCFIMHSSVLKRIRLGEMFAGHPPWGTVLHNWLLVMANNYQNFKSNVNGTFHLGDDRSNWLPKVTEADNPVTYPEIERQRKEYIKQCPIQIFGNHSYTLLNTINCGKMFQYDRWFHNHTIPSFVRPGYEAMYLKHYPKVWHYSEPNGLGVPLFGPNVAADNNTTISYDEQENNGTIPS